MYYPNPLLKLDFYKVCHPNQYDPRIKKLVSYFTPRMSRIPGQEQLVMFGLQGFLKDCLIREFYYGFFARPKSEVLSEYRHYMDHTIGEGAYDIEKVEALYDLGYLPVEIRAVPEGFCVDMHVPMFEIFNTHPDFAWVVGTLETMLSCYLWHVMVSANVGMGYREIVNTFYDITVDDDVPRARALGDFSMRGQESAESAARSSAAFCLSFLNTATVPAITWLEQNYNCDCESEPVAFGAISTEHSVMCSSFAIDGDEITMLRRLLTELYPHQNFSVVSDSYDYWNVVDNLIPQLKNEILNHDGVMFVRGDSGDPVEIVTQTVFHLWETFGGSVNSKGFKVLDPHIRVIYGDSITQRRLIDIYRILRENGFACNNCVLGVGSFSMQCFEMYTGNLAEPQLLPYTRDSYGIAVKATYAEDAEGNPIFIHKDPKTDTGKFKKSQRGCCSVHFDGRNFSYVDGLTFAQHNEDPENLLIPVFRNSIILKEYTLQEVRKHLWRGKF